MKNCFIPICHVLDFSRNWEDIDELPPGTVRDRSEYGDDFEVSSLSRLRGERRYLRALKHGRMNRVIDIVCDYDQLDG